MKARVSRLLSLFILLFTIIKLRVKKTQKTKRLLKLKQQIHRHAKLTFVPHGANQYRPHLIRRYGLIVLLLLVIGAQAGYNFSTSGSVLGAGASVTAADLLANTNEERANNGIKPLKVNSKLSDAAYMKAQDMLRQQYWAHVAPDGTTPWQWLAKVGYNYASAGENLARNFTSSDAAVTAWMASPEHRKNILGAQYSEVGFATIEGVLDGKSTTLIVALYGQSAGTAVIAGANMQAETAAASRTIGLLTRLDIALQSMTPAAIGSIFAMLAAAFVALLAHIYRGKMPKHLRQSWYRHHGIMKVGGMVSVVIIVVVLYSGGQI